MAEIPAASSGRDSLKHPDSGPMMRILLVGNYPLDAQESMQRFALVMKNGLLERGHAVAMAVPALRVGRIGRRHAALAKWLGYIDKFALFPGDLRRALRWADIVHVCDHSNAPYVRHLGAAPHIVTCHDMLAIRSALGEIPENRTRWTGRQLQRMILAGLRCASRVACVSESTREDLMRLTGLPPDRAPVVPNGLNHAYSPMDPEAAMRRISRLGIDTSVPLILHVGGNQWYKNRMGVLRTFEQLRRRGIDATLLMVGKPWTEAMHRFVEQQRLAPHVVPLTAVDNEDLRALYSLAHMLLFPSLCEGFGWPIIEAQACGCPVVSSDRAPMTHIAGGAALFIDPDDSEQAAMRIASKWEILYQQRAPGLVNAAKYDTPSMIEAYLRQYAVMASGKEHRH